MVGRLLVEFALPADAATERLLRAGAKLIPGYDPVPVEGEDGRRNVVITIHTDDPAVDRAIRSIPGVVSVFGDPSIAAFEEFAGF